MATLRPIHLARLSLSFHSPTGAVYLSAWPRASTSRPWDTQLELDHDAAVELTRSLVAALHYMGTPYAALFPGAGDLPDDTHATPGGR